MNDAPISKDNPFILASASPRRKELLTQVGLPFTCETSRVPEDGVNGSPERITCTLAEKKVREVYSRISPAWMLGTDTVVVVDHNVPTGPEHTILGKPRDEDEAFRMLRLLSGMEHRVVSGFCIISPSGKTAHMESVTTRVRIKHLTDEEIRGYIQTREPFGKAGSYAIQGIGSFLVTGISGSYTNVVGLPLYELIKALVNVGALTQFPLSNDLGKDYAAGHRHVQ